MQTFFSILLFASAISVILSVLFQESSEGGLGAIGGGGGSSDSPWGMTRGKSKEAILQKITIVSAVVFMISTVILAAS